MSNVLGYIVDILGPVFVKEGESDKRLLAMGDPVHGGDLLFVPDGSTLLVRTPDGRIVRVSGSEGEDEQILADTAVPEVPPQSPEGVSRHEQDTGDYTVYGKHALYQSSGFGHVRLADEGGDHDRIAAVNPSPDGDTPVFVIDEQTRGPEPIEIYSRETRPHADLAIGPQENFDAESLSGLDMNDYFSAPDGSGGLTFSATGLPPGLAMDPDTGIISGTFDGSASQGNDSGVYTVTVTATTGLGESVSQTFPWTVHNIPPVAVNDQETTDQDTAISVSADNGILGNDSAPDGDSIEVSEVQVVAGTITGAVARSFSVTAAEASTESGSGVGEPLAGSHGGVFVLYQDGSYDFDPNGDFDYLADGEEAQTSIDYTITDGEGGEASATLTITITGTNDMPEAVTPLVDQAGVDGEAITDLDVSGHFTDRDTSDTLSYSATGLPEGLVMDPVTGVISGSPVASASQGGTNGVYEVTVTATDDNGASVDQTFVWTITNPAPEAVDDARTTDEDTLLEVAAGSGVLTNDRDPDGDPLVVSAVNGSAANLSNAVAGNNGGQFTLNTDGSYSFDPAGDFGYLAAGETAETTIEYTVDDGNGGTDTATLTVTVTGSNDAPVPDGSIPAQNGVDSDPITDLDVSGYFDDPDGSDTLTYTASGLPDGLVIDPDTGVISGTPSASASQGGDNGDGIYEVTITADDGNGGSVDQTLTWTLSNPAPEATDDTGTTDEDSQLNVAADAGVLINDRDSDGDPLVVSAVNGDAANLGSAVAGSNGGQFILNADGSYSFDPNGNFGQLAAGESARTSITYTVDDGNGGTETATLTVTVTGTNDVPVKEGSIPAQSAVDSDPITDLDVSGYFKDPDDSDTLTYTASGLPDGLVIDPDTGVISGTPSASASQGGDNGDGIYEVTITADDGNGGSVDQTLTWTLSNPAPYAINDTGTSDEDSVLVVAADSGVLTNDTDPDGDTLVVSRVNGDAANLATAVGGSNGGQFTLNADGSYSFDPAGDFETLNPGETATTSIEYTLSDGNGGTDTAILTVTVTGKTDGEPGLSIEDNNGAEPGVNSIAEDAGSPVTGELSVTAPDGLTEITINGQTVTTAQLEGLSSAPVSISGDKGSLTLTGFDSATGRVTYEYQQNGLSQDHSAGDNSITDSFTVTVTDDKGSATAPQDLTILITDTAPEAESDQNSIEEGATVAAAGNVIGGSDASTGDVADSEGADGATVTGIASDNVPASTAANTGGALEIDGEYGTLTIDPDGSYSYLLDNSNLAVQGLGEDETLDEVFTYTLTDGDGDTDDATLTLTITGADDAVTVDIPENTGATTPDANTSDQVVFESGLAGGSGPDTDDTTVQSSFTLKALDGLNESGAVELSFIDINGAADSLTLTKAQLEALDSGAGSQTVVTGYGELVLNGYSQAGDGTITVDYEYTLTEAPGEAGEDVTDRIEVRVTDRDGDSSSQALNIRIIDDTPSADVDQGNLTEGATLTVDATTGVLANDTAGADGWADTGAVVGIEAGDTGTTATGGVGGRIDGDYGYITLNADGSYEYVSTADAITADAQDIFTYTVRDGDGDETSATLTINLADVSLAENPITETVNESGLTGGSTEGDGSQTSAGQVSLPAGVKAIPQTAVSTDYGEFSIDEDGSYSYTLTESTAGEGVTDSFTYTTQDEHGNTVTNTVTITITDDGPVAVADSNSVTEDATPNPVTGNVMTGESAGDQADTQGADGAQVSGVQVGTVVAGSHVADGGLATSISGDYGSLVLQSDGSYSYQLDNSNPVVNALKDGDTLNDVFSYTLTDGDGDQSTATLTITINGSTDGTPAVAVTDSNGAEAGDQSIAEDASSPVTGSFTVSAPDGLKSVTVGGETLTVSDLEALNSTSQTITGSEGTLTLTGYDASTGEVSYEYQQSGTAKDHRDGDESVTDSFTITVTDNADVESAPDTLDILITDTAPVANADTGTVEEDGAVLAGNVMTDAGTGQDEVGADVTTVTGVAKGNVSGEQSGGVGGSGVAGDYGTLTLNSDGSYSYVVDGDNAEVNALKDGESLTETFSYTLKDADGDWSTTTVTITINGNTDGAPGIVPADENGAGVDGEITVKESALANGSDAASDEESASGTLTISAGDGLKSATIGGQEFTLTELNALNTSPSAPITVEGGELVLTGFTSTTTVGGVPTAGELSYTYTLTGERTHSGAEGEALTLEIPLSVTDAGNATSNGTLTVRVEDDTPIAEADTGTVTEGASLSVDAASGVLNNDTSGADGWANSGSAVVGAAKGNTGSSLDNSSTLGTAIAGDYGTLTLNADGSYTYVSTANAVTGDETDVFTYTVKDADGDLTQATLTINVNDVTGVATDTTDSVDEAGLSGGTDSASGSNKITDGSLDLQSGWRVEAAQSGSTGKGSWSVDTDGNFTYELTTSTTDGSDDSDSFTYTAVDQYGNTVQNTVTITIVDDQPQVTATATEPGSLSVDETTLGTGATNADFVKDVFGVNYGADGAAATDATVYSLNVTDGTASGVTDTATGTDIYLFMDGGDVVGRVGNNASGDIAFRIEIDADTGAVALTQNRPLEHSDTSNHDDSLSLTDGAIQLVATATDGDGDTASGSVNVGNNFTFRDDGPSISTAPADGTVDEAHLPQGSATPRDSSQIEVSNSLNVDFGSDGAGDVQFTTGAADSTVATLEALGLKSDRVDLVYEVTNDGHTLTAYKGSVASGNEVFTVDITDPTGTPGYTFTLIGALDHVDGSGTTVETLDLEFDKLAVTDGDGDSISADFKITVEDDAPDPGNSQSYTVDEDSDDNTFVTNADATGSNTSIGDGSGTTVAPSHGSATVNADGTITYVPDANYSGTDTFTYTTVTDNDSKTYTVVVTVDPVSDAPDLEADKTITTLEDTPVDLGLKTPVIVDDSDQNGADDGDNPERLGAITLTLDDAAPAGTVLTKSDGTELTVNTSGGYTIVIVETPGGTDVDTGLHLSEGLPTENVNYLTQTEYEALQIKPAENHHENVEVTVSVDSYEVDGDGKQLDGVDGANSQQSISVDVQAVTDTPAITLEAPVDPSAVGADSLSVTQPSGGTNGKITVSMSEDTTLDLRSVLNENLADTDGSESYWYSLSGLPEGTVVSIGGKDYTADASGNISIPADEYLSSDNGADPGFTITPPDDYSSDGVINATITLNTLDSDDDTDGANPTTESVSVDLELTVTPVAGDVTASGVTTAEDTAVNFLENIRVTDTGTGNEVIDKVVFEVPTDWEVGQSTVSNGATWTANLSGSTYTIEFTGGSEADREAVLDGFTITPPAHSSADADIELTITTTDTNTTGSDTQVTNETVKVEVTSVGEVINGTSDDSDPDDLSMVGNHTYASAGEEDAWFTLGIDTGFDLSGGWSNEDSDGSEQTFALLTPQLVAGDGSQEDARGSQFRYSTNGDTTEDGGAWVTQTFGGSPVEVPVEYLDTLQFLAPPDFSGKFDIRVQALTRDTDPDDGSVSEQISGESILSNILITPVADTPTTAVTARVKGNEDEAMPLSIRPASSDPSETFNVTIDAIPDGAEIIYDGQTLSAGATGLPEGMTITDNGNGTWKVEIEGFDPVAGDSMTLTPPPHSNEPFTLNVSTVSVDTLAVDDTDSASDSDSFELSISVTPKGVADEANVDVVDPSAQSFVEEDVDSAGGVMLTELLNGTPSLIDNDGSETLSFKLSDLPAGFGVEGATSLGNGEWVFAASELANVKITTPANFSGTSDAFTLAVVTTENDGDSLTEDHSVQIRITPSPEATMNLSTSTNEDVPQKLDFSAQQQNGESGESITEVWIKASDLTGENFTLTYGENGPVLADGQAGVTLEDGWYKLTGDALNNIYLDGNANWSGNDSFTVQYKVEDPGDDNTVDAGSSMSGDQTYSIGVAPVTDQPDLAVTSGDISMTSPGDVTINLNIANEGINGGDYDGSEQLTRILLDNVPEGVIVEGADFIGGNQWLFITSVDFNGALNQQIRLQVQQEADNLTNYPIDITVTTEDAGNGQLLTASTTVTLTTDFPDGEDSTPPAEIIAWEQTDFDPTEDTAFTLSDAFNGEIQNGVTDNGFNITLSSLPEGMVVTGMTATVINGETVWTASGTGGNSELQTLMSSITVTPPADWNRHDGDFEFDAKLTTYAPSGLRNDASVEAVFDAVQPVSDEPEISISAPAVGEDSDLTFTINLSNEADDPNWTLVDGKLYLQLDESGIDGTGVLKQDGTPLSTSAVSGVSGIPDGSYYVIEVTDPASSIELTYTASGEHVSGSVGLTAWAQSQEDDSSAVETGSVTQTGVINPVNSGYDFAVADVSGTENASQLAVTDKSNVIQLNVIDNGLADSDGSESIGTVLLSDVPNGFLVYVGNSASDASLADLSNNAGGDGTTNTWLLGNGEIPAYIGIMPPQYWSGTVEGLKLQVTSGEGALSAEEVSTQTFSLTVEAQADGLTLAPTPSFGEEGDIIPLNLNHELKDPDSAGSGDESTETLTLEFTGMGEHAAFYLEDTLISGTDQVSYNESTGVYTVSGLTTAEAETLGFVQAENDLGNVQVRAQTVESANGDTSGWTDWKDADTSGVTGQYGTSGGDSLLWTGDAIDAFGGDDVIQLRFDESVDGSDLGDNLSNIEKIDMTGMGDNSITSLSIQDVLDMTDGNNELSILGDGEDSVSLSGGWTQGGTDDAGFVNYTVDGQDAVLKIMESVQVTVE